MSAARGTQGGIAFVAIRKHDVPGDRFRPIREVAVARVDPATLTLERLYSVRLTPTPVVNLTTRMPGEPVRAAEPVSCSLARAVSLLLETVQGCALIGWNIVNLYDDLEWLTFDAEARWPTEPALVDFAGLGWATTGRIVADAAGLAAALGTSPPTDSALADVLWMATTASKLRETHALAARIMRLRGDEAKIAGHVIERLEAGQRTYGPWRVDDGRDYRRECFEELIDGLHYLAAEVERQRRGHRRVVLCVHAEGPHSERFAARVLAEGALPVVAGPVLRQCRKDGVPVAVAHRLVLDGCHEVRVYGPISAALRELVATARSRRMPVREYGVRGRS